MDGGEIVWREDDESNTPVLTMNEARSIFRDVVSGLDYRKSTKGKSINLAQ